MLWSSYLFLLRVDGVSITTNRNWTSESVSLAFLVMINDVIRLHRLMLEPSDHSISVTRPLCRELTVNDIISIVQKLIRFQVAVSNGDLKVARSIQG